MSWLEVVHQFANARGVAPRWLDVLNALSRPFPRGGPPAPKEIPWAGSFEDLEEHLFERPRLTELDPEQAEMFYRRIDTVITGLQQLSTPTSRVLAVGLKVRLAGMARAQGPQGIRVRALADFYYSQLAQLVNLERGTTAPFEAAAAALTWKTVAPGLDHAQLQHLGPMGPMHLNMLKIDPSKVRMEVTDLRTTDGDLAHEARVRGALAATSGGFFLYSEPDIEPPSQQGDPVGLWVGESIVRNPPFLPRGALLAGPDWVDVGVVSLPGCFTRADGRIGPDTPSLAVLGDTVIARGRSLKVPLNGAVVSELWEPPFKFRGREIVNGVAGGPMLLESGQPCIDLRQEGFWGTAPPVTFSQDETGDQNLLPRLAAGIHRDGSVILAAIDGRDLHSALGMTLAHTARWMQILGCERAVNLDGGSSKRMVVNGRGVDLSSTEIKTDRSAAPVRPVRTGIFWFRR